MFNVISRKTILEYCQKHRDASIALKVWYHAMQEYDRIKAGKVNFN